jgi:hypothetical protein
VALYIPFLGDVDLEKAGLRSGDAASNVTIYETGATILNAEQVGGIPCVSPIIAYLDLLGITGRGQDAATHLYDIVVEPRYL